MNVLVINQCATNKGDRAVLYFILRELFRSEVEHVTVSTSRPAYWTERPDYPPGDVRFIPWGWDISRSTDPGLAERVMCLCAMYFRRWTCFPLGRRAVISGRCPWYLPLICNREYLSALRESDLVISTGGHRVTTINAPDAVSPQLFDLSMSLAVRKPLVLWSQSIGPFHFRSAKNEMMVKKILSGSDRIMIRNEASAASIREMGVSLESVSATHESVFGLYDVVQNRIQPSKRPAVVGVAVYATNRGPEQYREYVRGLVTVLNHAIERGYQARFFPMELQGDDRACIEDVRGGLQHRDRSHVVEGFPGTVEHINQVAGCRLFIGHKTHSVIFALVAGTPLVAMAYHKKTEDFMAQFDLSRYCIPDRQMTGARLIEVFDNAAENLDAIFEAEQGKARVMSEEVQGQFARMIVDMKGSQERTGH